MKIVVLGAKGMLGHAVMDACRAAGLETCGFDLPDVDITRGPDGLRPLTLCDWAINCAAYTNVDGAEIQSSAAFKVNRDGAGYVAAWCAGHGAGLAHISTDHVFDGLKRTPYREDDPTGPVNVYGASKLAGEQSILAHGKRHLIIRTQALFGCHGKNFIKAIASRALEPGGPLRVVNDQTTCPTYTRHLAEGILRLLKTQKQGIVHLSSEGSCTWYELARAVVAAVRPTREVVPVASADYVTPARRPAYSVLDKARCRAWTTWSMPSWENGLAAYLGEWKHI